MLVKLTPKGFLFGNYKPLLKHIHRYFFYGLAKNAQKVIREIDCLPNVQTMTFYAKVQLRVLMAIPNISVRNNFTAKLKKDIFYPVLMMLKMIYVTLFNNPVRQALGRLARK